MCTTNRVLNPETLKLSYYNFYIPKDNGSIYLFNSATGAIVEIYEKEYLERLAELRNEATGICYNEDDEIISTFYQMGILVPDSRDEYEYIRYSYERDVVRDRILNLTLITTRQCNLRCVYCYEKHENKPMLQSIYSRILKYIESSLKNKVYAGISIGLFGGEPFVEYDHVIQFLEKTKEICTQYEVPFHVGATTNGALIYPERFERLIAANCTYYQISIDGFAETHDKYRVNANGNGSWQQIIDNLNYMNSTSHKFRVTIRTNFNDEVFSRAKEWYRYISENFDHNRFTVYYEGIKKLGGINDTTLNVLNKNQVIESIFDVAQYIHHLGIRNDVVDTMTRPYSKVCYASKHNHFLIDYDGTLLKCTLSLDDELNRIGYIDEDGTIHLNETKHSKWVGHKIELPKFCTSCKVLPICFGGRCVNGRLHGDRFQCDPESETKDLANLISTFH